MMSNQWVTKNSKTSKRGLFVNGSWHCDCEPRLPAEKFQVKNGGKNHGRWFYTCQKPQPKRCPFFLWSDEAKVREEAAVLSNSRSEPPQMMPPMQTPRTPNTPLRQMKLENNTPATRSKTGTRSSKAQAIIEAEEFPDEFDWSSGADDDLVQVADAALQQESSRKIARTANQTSPGKGPSGVEEDDRGDHSRHLHRDSNAKDDHTTQQGDDTLLTPSKPTNSLPTGLLSPQETPSVRRKLFLSSEHETPLSDTQLDDASPPEPSDLALEVLKLLTPIARSVSVPLEHKIVRLLNHHALRIKGIEKGRDVVREALKTKEKRIAELQTRIVALEHEREANRTIIAHLKNAGTL